MENILRAAARSYQTPDICRQLIKHHPPLILSGVTAAGKNTVSKVLARDGDFERLITYTTRSARGDEVFGRDYWFIDEEEMFDRIKRRIFIEVQVIHDFVYGSPIEGYTNILHTGQQPMLTIDVNGAALISKMSANIRPFFLIPPSYEEWMRRLGSRDFLSDGERNRRLHSAAQEISVALNDNSFVFIISEDLDKTADDIRTGLIASEASQRPIRELANELYEYIKNQ